MLFLNIRNNFATSANLNATNFWLGYQTDGTFSTWPCADPSVAFSFIPWSTSMPVNNGQSYCAASLVASNYSASNYDCSITAMSSLICKESNKSRQQISLSLIDTPDASTIFRFALSGQYMVAHW